MTSLICLLTIAQLSSANPLETSEIEVSRRNAIGRARQYQVYLNALTSGTEMKPEDQTKRDLALCVLIGEARYELGQFLLAAGQHLHHHGRPETRARFELLVPQLSENQARMKGYCAFYTYDGQHFHDLPGLRERINSSLFMTSDVMQLVVD